MTRQEISDLFDKHQDGYQAWRGNGVMTKGAFIEAVTEALRIHDVVGRSERLCRTFFPDGRTTSATKCKFCGKEKWEH
jgi:hypothetical protein